VLNLVVDQFKNLIYFYFDDTSSIGGVIYMLYFTMFSIFEKRGMIVFGSVLFGLVLVLVCCML